MCDCLLLQSRVVGFLISVPAMQCLPRWGSCNFIGFIRFRPSQLLLPYMNKNWINARLVNAVSTPSQLTYAVYLCCFGFLSSLCLYYTC